MNKKLLVVDLDGTLTNSQKEVSYATKTAILNLLSRGHKCMIASGRAPSGIKKIADDLEFEKYGGYILCYNGAKIIDYSSKEVIYQQTVPHDILSILYNFSKTNNCSLITYSDKELISANGIDKYISLESQIEHLPIHEVDKFAEYITFPINKCIMTADSDYAAKCEVLLRNLIGDKLDVYRSDPFFIEIVPKGVDKSISLAKMLPILGIEREDCIACGDGCNDIRMIKFAGIGVAMGNAQQVVKDAADVITLTNDEDGIIPIIEKYFE